MGAIKYFTIIAGLLSVFLLNGQNNIHVAINGNDSTGDGSIENPFETIQQAADNTQPGDTVYVHEGTYRNNDFNDDDIWDGNNLLKITANGTVDNYITFMPYHGDHVILEFDATYGVLLSNASYIIFEGFEVKGISGKITQTEADDAWGLYIDKADGLIYNLEDEIGINYPDPSPYNRGDKIPKISKNLQKPSYYSGKGIVASKSHHIIIRNNIVRDTPGSGIRANGSDYVTISNNEVYNCTFYTTAGSGAVTVAEATVIPVGDTFTGPKIILENNYVHHNENRMVSYAPSKDFLTFVIDEGTGLFLTRNTTYDHGYIKISNNVSAYNGASGIVCHFTNRAIIEHNTLYKNGTTNDGPAGGIGINNADDVQVKNNISYAEPDHWALGILANPVTNMVVESNILYNENGAEDIARNIGNGWVAADPLFENAANLNFVLSKNSPALNASTTTQIELFDILGNPRNDGSADIGAYERSYTTGYEMVEKMGRGINLGNVLSAPVEGNWSSKATEQYFKDVAEAGFTNVRIPMDFFGIRTTGDTSGYSSAANTANQYDGNLSDYVVDSNYLDRLEQIINWALNNNLVTIIDFHGSDLKNEFLHTFKSGNTQYTDPTSAKRKADLEKFNAIWTAIATRFKNYSQNLLFEIVNEPYFEVSASEMDVLNTGIIDIIRNSGANNTTRFIVLTGGSKNAYEAPLQIDPEIIANNTNLIATFHYYKPFNFTSSSKEGKDVFVWGSESDKTTIRENFDEVKEWATTNKIPILLGEFSADNEGGYNYSTGNYGDFGGPEEASRVTYHRYLAEQAIDRGFAFAAWDAGNKSNKTIHKRTDDSSVVNFNPDGTIDYGKWVENVKQALLGAGTWPDCNDPTIINEKC
ncbi:MAG: cellulase family glycosylhydrolase, partial [Bacteroidetes bacterium]|nr:cellulase family glycosylhydrolase [Bacteroidota bacterium]